MSRILASFFVVAFAFNLSAAEVAGIQFPDTYSYGGKKLVLNGVGLRLATIFNIKVYAAGLYLEKKSKDSKAIIDSPEKKVVRMVFIRDVDGDDIKEAWMDGMKNQCADKKSCDELVAEVNWVNGHMQNMKEGDEMEFRFDNNAIEVVVKKKSKGKNPSQSLSKIMMGCWIGVKPPNKEIKSGMLSL